MPTLRATAGAIAGLGAACVAYGTFVERHWFRRRDVVLDGVLREGPPLTVVHVADTHLTPPDERMAAFVARTADEVDADLVVATGDLLGAVGAEDATAALLAPLVADGTPGLVVLGSNDLYGPVPKSPATYFTRPEARKIGPELETERFVGLLEADGWRVLHDGWDDVEVAGRHVALSALDDPHLFPSDFLDADVVRHPGASDADLHLGLVHAPYVASVNLLTGVGCDVVLAGHTHGGQVRVWPTGALVGNCDLPLDRVRGASRWGDAWLHVTPGLGQSCYAPYRFGCRPEVSVLHLSA